MLSVDNAPDYLLSRGLISLDSILDGHLTVTSAVRRNRNLRVKRMDGPSYLLKQHDPSQAGEHTLRCEASFYLFCQQEPAVTAVRGLLPRLLDVDEQESLIALELLLDALPLWSYYRRFDAGHFPVKAAGAVGQALGIVHLTFRLPGLAEDSRLAWMHREIPWVLCAHKPSPDLLATISPANYQTLRILQTEESLAGHLDRLGRIWKPQALIHNDIKSDNILVIPPAGEHDLEAAPEVRLVDWELVQIGDPAWDLAGALHDFVLLWVSSMPSAGSPEEMVAGARYPLPALQRAIRAFWQGYCATAGLTSNEAEALVRRAVPFSAARLIQSAYESAQTSHTMPLHSRLFLQISANLLADPEVGQIQLYGLFQEMKP